MALLIVLAVPAASVMGAATVEFCVLTNEPPASVMGRVTVFPRPFCPVPNDPPVFTVIVPVPAMVAPSDTYSAP